jgi:hypothetical protein
MSLLIRTQQITVPVNIQFKIFLKILSYNRNLDLTDGKLNILIIYQNNFRTSLNVKNNIIDYFEKEKIYNFENVPLLINSISINNETDIENYLNKNKCQVIYITPVRSFDFELFKDLCHKQKILSLTGVTEYVYNGISVGIDIKGEKPDILINLKSAKLEGADFSSQLLKISTIIEK